MAASRNSTQVLDILSEHADISATLKLVQLSELMRSSDTLTKDEFQGILHSLPVDLVSSAHSLFVCFNCTHNFNQTQSASLHISTIFQWDIQVSSADVCGCGTLLQDAIRKNKQHFVRLLLEFGLYHFYHRMAFPERSFYGWFIFITLATLSFEQMQFFILGPKYCLFN